MQLTAAEALASIAVMSAVTFLTRALPFLLFDRGEHPPKIVLYLGKVLPRKLRIWGLRQRKKTSKMRRNCCK